MADARLTVDRLVAPLGFDEPDPRLAWRGPGRRFTVRVGWDGQERWSAETNDRAVRFDGPPIPPETRVAWRVTSDQGEVGASFWETGPTEWGGGWIEGERRGGPYSPAPVPMFRRGFHVREGLRSARLYLTALGVVEPELDGARFSPETLTPGWTDYAQRVVYRAYDLTECLPAGEHEFRAVVGDGWYCGQVEWRPREMYGDRPRLRALIVLAYDDGSEERIPTDASWEVAYGPILRADLIQGQIEDRRQPWGPWSAARVNADVRTPIVGAIHEPVIEALEVAPVAVERSTHGRALVDFGQNLVGHVRLKAHGPTGKNVILRHGEVRSGETLDTGPLYLDNLRSAEQKDIVTLAGDPDGEVFEPRLTFHGFRYVEIGGLADLPNPDDVRAIVVRSGYPSNGDLRVADDPLLDQLVRNTRWGWFGNSVDVPTDCPQRDERLGWTGDAQVFCETSLYLTDSAAFWRQYIRNLADSQNEMGAIPPFAPNTGAVGPDGGPAWADAIVIIPWTVYQMTGDDTIIREAWPAMTRFMAYLEKEHPDGVRVPPEYKGFRGFGDWLSIDAHTPEDLIGTAFWAHNAELMSRMAVVLGESEEPWREVQRRIRRKFQDRYASADGKVGTGSQTSLLLALHFGLLPESSREAALDALVADIRSRSDRLSAGFVGSPYLFRILSENGREDVARDLLHQTAWPSWLYAVTKGATTIWERWDGWTEEKGFQDKGMNSFNHYAYGAITGSLFSEVFGLSPMEPGFRRVRIAPCPDVTHAREWSGVHESPYGPIRVAWSRDGSEFRVWGELPPGVSGTLSMPSGDEFELQEGPFAQTEPDDSGTVLPE